MKPTKMLLMLSVLLMAFVGTAAADWRPFVYSYDYMTAYKGEREIEYYLDYSGGNSNPYALKHQLEFEYGITSHWMASIYGVFSQTLNNFSYTQTKIQTRYRFGQEGGWLVDPAVYLEYKKSSDSAPDVIEGKIIIGKKLGKTSFIFNYVLEQDQVSGSVLERAYTLGVSQFVSPVLRLSLEFKRQAGVLNPENYIIPGFSLLIKGLKWNVGIGLPASEAAQGKTIARSIFSWEL